MVGSFGVKFFTRGYEETHREMEEIARKAREFKKRKKRKKKKAE